MDEQFEVGDNSPTESDGNHLANAGEYNSYQIVVRNTGIAGLVKGHLSRDQISLRRHDQGSEHQYRGVLRRD